MCCVAAGRVVVVRHEPQVWQRVAKAVWAALWGGPHGITHPTGHGVGIQRKATATATATGAGTFGKSRCGSCGTLDAAKALNAGP